jgi:molybdopterin molybdotransferase
MESILLSQAVDVLRQNCRKITETEMVSVDEAAGRVLAQEIYAPIDQPPFPRSPLDGYALRSTDTEGASRETPVSLKVIDEVFAGGFCQGRVTEGCAVRIMTGAPVPEGADCIIMQEDTDYGMETVNIYRALRHLQNYCFAGEDYKKGTLVMKPGMQLKAAEIGVIAGMGIERISVCRKLRALVMSTGSELVSPGKPLKPGQIYDSNLHMLLAQLRMWDIEVTAGTLMDDEPERACAFIRENAAHADIILTTGGVSVGKKDIMHDVLEILGAEKLFWKVRLKPGMPTLCGLYDGKLIIALSGNPYGAIANLHLLVRPVLAAMAGRTDLEIRSEAAVYDTGYPKRSPVTRYVRGVYENGHVRSSGSNDSGVLASMIGCNCMIVIPAGTEKIEPGETVEVVLL